MLRLIHESLSDAFNEPVNFSAGPLSCLPDIAGGRALPVSCEQTPIDHWRRVQESRSAAGPAIAQERDDRRAFEGRMGSMDLPLCDLSALDAAFDE